MISSNPTSLKVQLNSANPNTLPSKLQALAVGSMFTALTTFLRQKAPAASPYVAATAQALPLPEDAKAAVIFSAWARVGTAAKGPLTVVAGTPATTQIGLAPNGDILLLGSDAYTSVDVVYLPEKYDVVELTLPVASNTLVLPPSVTALGAVLLLEAESLVGTLASKLIIDAPGTSVATGHSAFDLAKLNVKFAAADAVTSARVKLGIGSSVDVQALLEAQSASI